jgi:hypothetical protein
MSNIQCAVKVLVERFFQLEHALRLSILQDLCLYDPDLTPVPEEQDRAFFREALEGALKQGQAVALWDKVEEQRALAGDGTFEMSPFRGTPLDAARGVKPIQKGPQGGHPRGLRAGGFEEAPARIPVEGN